MDAETTAREINERLSKDTVPMDELRARAEAGSVVLEGSRVARLPGMSRTITPQNPETYDATYHAEYPPEEAVRAVDDLQRNWPFD